MKELGRLERIELRNVWKTEAQDFTPWLARDENLALLGETLGLELELEAVERNVGPFRADILCKDAFRDNWVLIENQLERTDHTHLGQLITYAAGLDAVTIVWIASRVAEEHRAAADWLNEITDDNVRFFVLEVELWKIADSPAAPKFNVVSKPNDWSRSTASAKRVIEEGDLSSTQKLQREYWDGLETKLSEQNYPINPVKPLAQSWLNHGIGRSGVSLGVSMNTRENWIRVQLALTGNTAKGYFDQLLEYKMAVEEELRFPVEWQRLEGKQEARICVTRRNSDPTRREDWQDQHKWLLDTMLKFQIAFSPLIRNLDRDAAEGTE